ncbi:hypothetical protein C8R44DRAFT_864541 [Mycena epipterygia]|nr:hypothetical protein C8R44DRAFT_864541 [Mycena epipterygia]
MRTGAGFGYELQVFLVGLHIVALCISLPFPWTQFLLAATHLIAWMMLDGSLSRARRHGLVARSGVG